MTRHWPRPLYAGALLALMLPLQLAHAQYSSWIDEKGTRVFSDRPPPPGTPASRIVKAPRALQAPAGPEGTPAPAPGRGSGTALAGDTATAPAGASPTKAAGADAAASNKPPSLAEREADFRKRSAERAEQDKKTTLEAERKAARAEQCASARDYEAQLTSGTRVSHMDANGERAIMSDEEKARQLERVRRAKAACS